MHITIIAYDIRPASAQYTYFKIDSTENNDQTILNIKPRSKFVYAHLCARDPICLAFYCSLF